MQLQSQKKKLQKRQKELEALIGAGWTALKHYLKPKTIAGEMFSQAFSTKTGNGNSALAENLSKMAEVFTKLAVEKAEERFCNWLKSKD